VRRQATALLQSEGKPSHSIYGWPNSRPSLPLAPCPLPPATISGEDSWRHALDSHGYDILSYQTEVCHADG